LAGGFHATLRNATVAGRFKPAPLFLSREDSLRLEYEGMVSASEASHGGHLVSAICFDTTVSGRLARSHREASTQAGAASSNGAIGYE